MFNRIRDPKIAKLNSLYTWEYLLACHSGMKQSIKLVNNIKPLFFWWNEDPSNELECVCFGFIMGPPCSTG